MTQQKAGVSSRVRSVVKRVPGVVPLARWSHGMLVRAGDALYGPAYAQQRKARTFNKIWQSNWWGSAESRSGPGSELEQTAAVRAGLAALLAELEIRNFLDVPCGDFNWMQEVAFPAGLHYTGGDIVPQLIEQNSRRFGSDSVMFRVLDLLHDPLPQADLVLCRDCLVHFSYADVFQAIANLKASGSTWLLTTHYVGDRKNGNIATGWWRPLVLTAAPFHFPPPVRLIDEKSTEENGRRADKRLALWRLAELPSGPRQA